ncbi:MAG TPA: bifunctional DNA-binding transcriptional regulator/O6-methylguanine-DNA methyltransferase Ada [Terriglobia bacterium]|nr:bifunctional DNA-binding transcriptional regulator/O6-methylguanine-DNA methyltransferase Ada [Terriglobia bacterium]
MKPSKTSIENIRWSAVLRRDRNVDGQFVYAVKTTGVYCRPSCSARRALRGNVTFHASCDDAERMGYRPCKRCRPREAGIAPEQIAAVIGACRQVDESTLVPTLHLLARKSGLSPFHFQRVFKRITGLTPKAYADAKRAQRTRRALQLGTTVTEAIYEGGFNTSGRFYAASARMLGMPPSTFRSRGRGETIRFAVGECSFGSILVASTKRGLCSILLGDDPDALVRELQDSFSSAELIGGDARFERLVARVVGFVDTPGGSLDLPLDIQGTAFQKRVWDAIQTIPAGTTRTYAQIAKQIGRPRASRAVAAACGSNRIAVAIPCHRVVRSDGHLSGYRWGIERKRNLLKRESDSPATKRQR